MESATTPSSEDDEWELRNDDGFVFKRRKRRPLEPPQPLPGMELELAAETRRDRKRKALLKVREQYRREIDQWEYLSSTLCEMEEAALQLRQTASSSSLSSDGSSTSFRVPATDSICGSVVDELHMQVDAQEAIIRDALNLCGIAEAMRNAQEEEEHQSLIDLPIWALPASPRKLLASLCDQ